MVATLAVPLLLLSAVAGLAQTVDSTLWVTDRSVFSIVRDGARVFIAGDFSYVGPPTGGAVAIDASTGVARKPYPKVTGVVYVVAPDGSGGWYLGGNFTSVQGQARNHIAHVDAGGMLTAWNPGASATVWTLGANGGKVYAGGDFTVIGGQARDRIAALDAVTGIPTAWNPGADNEVRVLTMSGGTMFVGGAFRNIGGQPRNYIAALDTASDVATPWSANAGNDFVLALVVSGGTVYASFSPFAASRIVALDAASGAALWSANANNYAYALALSGGTLYVGGNFSVIAGQPRVGIAALDAASGVATAFGAFPLISNGGVAALAVSGGTLFAGGGFTSIGGQSRNRIAALDVSSGAATSWNPNTNDNVWALAVSGSTVYVGGGFISVGGQNRLGIAALDAAGGTVTAWNANANNYVDVLAVSGNRVYVGGYFTSIGGQPRDRIAALDATSGAAIAWNPGAYSSGVFALEVSGSTVYAGGGFYRIGGQDRDGVAALDAASGAATAWNPGSSYQDRDPAIHALAASGGVVYVGGHFSSIGGQPRNYIAALDTITGAATPWNPGASDEVRCLVVSGSTVYAGGGFTSIGGQPRRCLAALDAVSGAATDWNPGADDLVTALSVSRDRVYVGGQFTTIGGEYRPHLAAIVSDLPTLTLLARFEATPATDGIELRWQFGEPGRLAMVGVERGASAAGPWESITPEFHDESGVTVALDRTAVHSGDYFYRLVVQFREGSQTVFGPVSATRGEPLTLSDLPLVSPNPTPGRIQVQYAVSRAGQVRLELLDVSGRVVATLADRIQEPGRYVAAWDGAGRRGRLAPGLYFVRLMAPDLIAVRKLAIVR